MLAEHTPAHRTQPQGFETLAKFTDKKREKFLKRLAETANITLSSNSIGMTRNALYNIRARDPEFAKAWDDALEEATDALEFEARRRALHGTDKPVFHRGKKCGIIKEYSDTLMIVLLKAHRGEKFKERYQGELSGPGGAPIPAEVAMNIHPAARTILDRIKADIADKIKPNTEDDLK